MMDENKCAARVIPNERWGSFHSYRCTRKAGFGDRGLYCKQHAKRYPADNQETVTMYAAMQENNSFGVAVCEVLDVTDKSVVIHSARAIFGYAPYKGHTKMAPDGQYTFFVTAREAFEWVQRRMSARADFLRSEIARIDKNLEPLERLLALEDLDAGVAEVVAERKMEIKKDEVLAWT